MGRVIVHHAALPHRGGAVRVARLLAAAQRSTGHDARLSFEVAENDPEALDGTGDAPSDLAPALPLFGPTPPEKLGSTLAALAEDALLHLHTSTDWPQMLAGLLAELPPRTGARRVILTLHDATPLTGGCAYPLDCPHFPACAEPCPRDFPAAPARQAQTLDQLRRLAPLLVSPSGWLAGLARQVLPELPVHVIPNGVPWPEASALTPKALARQALGIAPAARVALFAAHGGARAAYKSGPRWLEFWQAVRQGAPQALAYAVGGDEAWSGDGLSVWPYVDRNRLSLLMRAADALIYPTLADNHPLVLLEAAAQELAVVSFAVGGVPEILRHEETGLLAQAGDGASFIGAAIRLLADPALSRRLGREARARGGRRFAAVRMAADYAERID
ncbi:MAG TPA: glycosyltransferase [Humidesulfovibrio sp.]|uniref:glycosyltransferase n=1 Tax=Humidesulfovibrio sp. TaxID=2910988 RepID=UPI002CD2C542|nr:glycosyltransferase [Humidesulfovibrio sp.]HWR05100.1 glycosyltransferase [Humidesulfovibrio sp.]